MSGPSFDLIRAAGYTDSGFPAGYDEHRPSPPPALLELLCLVAQVERPRLVVDLGSGTGLSARVWADRADEVVGIEPSDQMRARAEAASAPNVSYVGAFSSDTGLAAETADIVTCSQSLHWMEPEPTFAEAARILRAGGVFAAYDYDWPPVVHWEVEQAFLSVLERVEGAAVQEKTAHRKDEHLARMEASGRFRFTREATLHCEELGGAERLVGMALSLGPLAVALRAGASEEELCLAALRATADRVLGDREVTWFTCYRVRYGVK